MRYISLVILFLIPSVLLHAQVPEFRFNRLGVSEGLPGHAVYDIAKDQLGFVWFATDNGLARYDGYDLVIYKPIAEDSTSLQDAFTTAVMEDQEGFIWVGTAAGGLHKFDPTEGIFHRYPVSPGSPEGTSHAFINDIVQTPDGTLWIGTDGGLDAYKDGQFTHYVYDAGGQGALRSPIVSDLLIGHDGTLWVATHAGLHEVDPATGAIRLRDTSLDNQENIHLNALFQDKEGALWIGSNMGLVILDPTSDSLMHFQHIQGDPQTLSSNRVYAIAQDASGIMWIGTLGNDISDGLNRFDPEAESFKRYRMDPDDPFSLSSNRVLSLLPDENGVLWIGTHTNGVNMADLHGERITRYTADQPGGLPENEVFSVYPASDGSVWVGTWTQGLAHMSPHGEIIRHYSPGNSALVGDNILCIYEEDDVLWVGTFDGLNKIDKSTGRVETYQHDPADPATINSNSVTSIERDRTGNLWLGSWNGGMSMLPAGSAQFVRFNHDPDDPNSLPDQQVFKIEEDSRGILWLKSWDSLYSYDYRSGAFQKLPVDQVNDFTFDGEGKLWLATNNQGLVQYSVISKESWSYSTAAGLPHESVTGIVVDDKDDVWVVTARGLSHFSQQTEQFRNFVSNPLIRGNKVGKNNASRGPDGTLYFSSSNGLFSLHPDNFPVNEQMIPTRLTDISIRSPKDRSEKHLVLPGDRLKEKQVTLAHSQNDISFFFAGLGFRKPHEYQYRYKLQSYDPSWIESGPMREARYTNLSPGLYHFEVQAANEDGLWSNQSSTIAIQIRPPWWQTPAAYMFYLLLAGSLLVGIIRYRESALNRRARELEDEVHRRTHEIEASHKIIEEQSERLVEHDRLKSRFFTNISHEFRTPLTLILGPLRDAQRGIFGQISHTLLRQIHLMERNGRRLQNLINQLLELSKFESGSITLEAQRVQILLLTQRIVRSFSSLAERKGIRLTMKAIWLDKEPKLEPELYVDVEKYEQALNNLLSNALKFTPEGGEVTVHLDVADNQFRVDVIDSGKGIPEEELEHVFERFKQLNPREHDTEGSSGIGLALAKEWVELHKGTLSVRNLPQGGACFTISIPLGFNHLEPDEIITQKEVRERNQFHIPALDEFEAFVSNESDAPSGSEKLKATVLLVEDHADLRSYIRGHLASRYHVVEAVDGKDAFERALADKPDLVISDVMMPEMDGYELCRAIKGHAGLADVPVILLTAKANEEDKVDGLRTGADDYMYKPFSANELMARAENLIDIRSILRQVYSTHIFEVAVGEVHAESADSVFMQRINDLVEQHIDNPNLSTEWLADEIGLSPRQLRRRIKDLTHLSATGFIRTLRMQRAAQLLVQEAGTISEIAYAVGFNDPKYFSRLFRQVYGVSPSEFEG